MAVSILSLPDEEPPSIGSIGRYGSHGSHVSPALSARSFAPDLRAEQREDTSLTVPKAPFLQIFKQMEVLHKELLAAYQQEVGEHSGLSVLPELPRFFKQPQERLEKEDDENEVEEKQEKQEKFSKTKSKTASQASLHLPGETDDHVAHMVPAASARSSAESMNSASQNPSKMSKKLMKKAREATVNMDWQIEADSLDSALQIREEWDLAEEKLLDLKRLQRRMSIGSMAGMQQVTVKRQYLVRSVKEDLPCYIVHPNSYKRLVWDCLAIFAIIFETTISPLHLYRMSHSMQLTAETMQWFASAFWTLDIPASFFTAVYINDVLRFRLRDIALNYLKSWCVYDVLMLAGDVVVLVMSETDVQAGVLRVARTRRLFRLLRVFQTIRLWKVLQGFPSLQNQLTAMRARFGSLTQPVIILGLLMAFAVHVLGSLWFAAGDTPGGWVREENLHEESLGHQYIRSLEWSVSKLPPSALKSTVELNTAAERWLGIFGTCMALLSGSLFISILTNTMAEVARERTRTTKILQAVRRYCHTYSISYAYTRQMKRYVEREHRRNEIQSHMSLLQTLPEGMVRELFQEARSRTLHAHAFFKEMGLSDPGMELNLCSQAINELYYLAGDVIFDTTSKAEGMYQIAAGHGIYFFWSQSEPMGTQRQKDFANHKKFQGVFGGASARSQNAFPMVQTSVEARGYVAEAALWVKAWRHQGQLQALIESRALVVSTELLFKVLQGYANCMANTVVYARCFVQELNKTAHLCKQVTDLPMAPVRDEGEKKRARSGSITSILFPPRIVQPENK